MTPWHKARKPETRRKMSEAQKGRPSPNKGIKHVIGDSEEGFGSRQREAGNTGNIGAKFPKRTPAEKRYALRRARKCRKTGKGRIPWNKGKTGIYSDETRRKMSEAHKRRNRSS